MVTDDTTTIYLTSVYKSLIPGRCGSNFKSAIMQHSLQIECMKQSREIALAWVPQSTFDGK